MISLIAAFLLSTNATPAEIVRSCREMIPADVRIEGRLIVRNRKGMVKEEHAYELRRNAGAAALVIDGIEVKRGEAGSADASVVPGVALTWSDLTLDYLDWDDYSFDAEKEGESVHGQICAVLLLRKGERTVRIWVDRKTGAMMQSEEIENGECVRRLWGSRIKKFGDRWMANVMEVERPGSGLRTKITVEKLDGIE